MKKFTKWAVAIVAAAAVAGYLMTRGPQSFSIA